MESGDWHQVMIEFADKDTAERVAVEHLRPALAVAREDGVITDWFFVRKAPCWRLRCRASAASTLPRLVPILDGLEAGARIVAWTSGIYEPEVLAFGGASAMAVAHELFCADSRSILDYLAGPGPNSSGPPVRRREMGVLLSCALLRGAGQDWYEQGDIWARVAEHRPLEAGVSAGDGRADLRSSMFRLMMVDPRRMRALASIADWPRAFEQAGEQLGELARRGEMERGLRSVLAHHVIFHWNRMGLSYGDQRALSTLATEVVMAEDGDIDPGPAATAAEVELT